MPLLSILNITKNFGTTEVLKGVSLELKRGELKVVMGPSGSGKSTLLRCINRLVEPTSGDIVFNNVSIFASSDVRMLRQKIGFVFQQFALYRHLTALENVCLALEKVKGLTPKAAKQRAVSELARFEMLEHQSQYPAKLSGGQKQRVALARALAGDPELLLLDEPTSALDPVLARDVARLITKLKSDGVTMLCVTHDLKLAKQVCTNVSFMKEGRLSFEGPIENLGRHEDTSLREFFKEQNDDPS